MELAFVVYLISVVESISSLFGWLCVGFLLLAGILCFVMGVEEKVPYTWKMPIIIAIFGVLFGSIMAIIPSEKQGYLIAGAYVTQKIAENENVQEIGGKVLELINQKLDEAIEQPKEKK